MQYICACYPGSQRHRTELKLTSLRAQKQSRSGVIVQREYKHRYRMSAVEGRLKQIRVSIPSLPANQLLPLSLCGAVIAPKSPSSGDKGGERLWPSNLSNCGTLTFCGVIMNTLLFGFQTIGAPSRLVRAISKAQNPTAIFEF